MQFTVILTSILSVASAAAITERSLPTRLFGRDAGRLVRRAVCGPLETPLCCQLDVDGVANLNCENGGQWTDLGVAGSVSTTEDFEATCAETGLTAECCVLAVGTDGLVCTAA